jgi:transposase
MTKSTRARYTLEFKEEAVRLVTGGERVATVARNLGLSEQTLHNGLGQFPRRKAVLPV